ncbi:hypothetical protein [Calothrix sp. NIES-3974]|uniref:hypothetical protein n=1 Tax=Calothrix sp. NIES-3974 TaxID=2005462 RepID=UPI000B615EE1|nr:hypothetical protein [Calothrix sp. NIES-3974]BAZ04159.1 hypothetical protein NIES3974_07910 [Calothrix sp. NIES-3974]
MIFPWMYATLFIYLLLFYPFLFLHDHLLLRYLLVAVNTGIFACVSYFIHSNQLSAWLGLRIICGSFMSGCGNITIFYIFFVLLYYYIQAVIQTIQGLSKGREFTQNWWIRTVTQRAESGGFNIWRR